MERKQAIALFLLLPFLACSNSSYKPSITIFVPENSLYSVGESLETHPNVVWGDYACSKKKKLPFVAVEKSEVFPIKIQPGESFVHHLVYSMCPKTPSGVTKGTLYRRLLYQGEPIFDDETKDFEFKPGRWSVNVSIEVPPQAKGGIYDLELELSGNKKIKFKKNTSFLIDRKAYEQEEAEVQTTLGAPSGIRAVGDMESVTLSWEGAQDKDFDHYEVFVNKLIGKKKIGNTVKPTFTVTGLKPGKVYKYFISAVDKNGLSSEPAGPVEARTQILPSDDPKKASEPAPSAPKSVKAEPMDKESINLTWEPNKETDIERYDIYTKKFIGKDKIGESVTPLFTATGLQPDDDYTFMVIAVNKNGTQSEPSTPVKARTLKPVKETNEVTEEPIKTAPTAPTALQAEARDHEAIHLTWAPNPEQDIDHYEIYIKKFLGKKLVGKSQITSATIRKLEPDEDYTFMAIAVNKDGIQSEPSKPVETRTLIPAKETTEETETPAKAAITPPNSLKAEASDTETIILTWESNQEADIDYYEIYNKKFFGKELIGKSSKTMATIKKLEPGNSYTFLVVAVNKDGVKSEPAPVEARTLAPGPVEPEEKVNAVQAPTAPVGVKAEAKDSESIILSWDVNQEPGIDHYEVYNKRFISNKLVGRSAKAIVSIRNLEPDTTYSFFIIAVNKDGIRSEQSALVEARTLKMY